MKSIASIGLFAAMCVGSIGCSMVQRPTISLKSMNIGNLSAQGFTMNFDLEIGNPNPVALPIDSADYELALGGVKVLDGKAKPTGNVPAKGSLVVALPVHVTFENVLTAADSLSKSRGEIPYGFDGGMSFAAPAGMGAVRAPVRFNGTFSAREILKDAEVLKGAAARELAKRLLGGLFKI